MWGIFWERNPCTAKFWNNFLHYICSPKNKTFNNNCDESSSYGIIIKGERERCKNKRSDKCNWLWRSMTSFSPIVVVEMSASRTTIRHAYTTLSLSTQRFVRIFPSGEICRNLSNDAILIVVQQIPSYLLALTPTCKTSSWQQTNLSQSKMCSSLCLTI